MTKNVHAWIDETGEKGLLHRLSSNKDDDFGLVCSLCVPAEREAEFRAGLRPMFACMRNLIGGEDKVHITDAFCAGDKAAKADAIRDNLFKFIASTQVAILYEARRLRVARHSFLMDQELQTHFRAMQDGKYAFPNQVDQDRLEVDMAVGLALKLDLFAYLGGADHLDLFLIVWTSPSSTKLQADYRRGHPRRGQWWPKGTIARSQNP
jgi:hypothetical protein